MFVRFSQHTVTSTAIIGIQNPFYFKPNKVSIEREVISSFGVFKKNNNWQMTEKALLVFLTT